MPRVLSLFAAAVLTMNAPGAMAAQGSGLTADTDRDAWPRWQGRLTVGSSLAPWQSTGRGEATGLKVDSVSLLGDYYFSRSLAVHGRAGGFRTTGGLVYGPRAQLGPSRPVAGSNRAAGLEQHAPGALDAFGPDSGWDTSLPYLGIGYSGLSLKGGWSFNADLGMMAVRPANRVRLGQGAAGNAPGDELMREMRLSPLLQFGVSYSF